MGKLNVYYDSPRARAEQRKECPYLYAASECPPEIRNIPFEKDADFSPSQREVWIGIALIALGLLCLWALGDDGTAMLRGGLS